jgi:uncharacterized phiE125 gp8 family phage protein
MNLNIVTPPAALPVTLERETLFARLDSNTYELNTIADLIETATARLDGPKGFLCRALMVQTWDLTLDRFPPCVRLIRLPLPPLRSVTSVKYLDPDGAEQTLSADAYRVVPDDDGGMIALKPGENWPAVLCGPAAVTIRFVAGYDTVPAEIRSEIVATAAWWFDERGKVGELMDGAAERLFSYRRISF